jgi:putative membrane protein
MARPFLTDESRKALADAVHACEAASSAELMVAVRDHSGSYLHADLIAGILVGVASLAALLFSPWPFELIWFLVDPVLLGILAGLATSRLPALRRLLTPRAARHQRVETGAGAAFVEKRLHSTTGRTGILLYLSILEREAAVVADLGVAPLAVTDEWRQRVDALREVMRRGGDGTAAAEAIRAFAEVLAPALVRSAEDVNELPNEVC